MVFVFVDPPSHPLPAFLVQVFITLGLTRLLGKLFAYIKQPRVIGEMIGGIVLGPSVLGRIPNFTDKIFPQQGPNAPPDVVIKSVDTFTVAANIGLIFFMFIMGLEWDAKQVRSMWKTSAPVGLGSILFPFGLGALVSIWWYDLNLERGFEAPDRTAFILFAGTSLSFTAFPVLCSILKSTYTSTTAIGQFVLACAALDDILAWCLLAIASSFAASGAAHEGAAVFGLAVGYVVVMVFVVRPLVHWVYHTFQREGTAADSSMFICLLFMMLLTSAFTCEVIGVHAFFGGFVAGVIIPKDGHLPEALAPKIELVVRELLLPLFFASSGIKTNVGELNTARSWGITLAIILIACCAKMIPALILSKLVVKESWRFCGSVAILMNTRGLVELIALNVALEAKILSPLLFTMLVVMAIVTTAMTGPLYHFFWLRNQPDLANRVPPTGNSFLSPTLDADAPHAPAETVLPTHVHDTHAHDTHAHETHAFPLRDIGSDKTKYPTLSPSVSASPETETELLPDAHARNHGYAPSETPITELVTPSSSSDV